MRTLASRGHQVTVVSLFPEVRSPQAFTIVFTNICVLIGKSYYVCGRFVRVSVLIKNLVILEIWSIWTVRFFKIQLHNHFFNQSERVRIMKHRINIMFV